MVSGRVVPGTFIYCDCIAHSLYACASWRLKRVQAAENTQPAKPPRDHAGRCQQSDRMHADRRAAAAHDRDSSLLCCLRHRHDGAIHVLCGQSAPTRAARSAARSARSATQQGAAGTRSSLCNPAATAALRWVPEQSTIPCLRSASHAQRSKCVQTRVCERGLHQLSSGMQCTAAHARMLRNPKVAIAYTCSSFIAIACRFDWPGRHIVGHTCSSGISIPPTKR